MSLSGTCVRPDSLSPSGAAFGGRAGLSRLSRKFRPRGEILVWSVKSARRGLCSKPANCYLAKFKPDVWTQIFATSVVTALVKAVAAPTHQPRNLPFASLAQLFMGRDKPLDELRAKLAAGKGAAVTGVALHGLGGVGKTRIAVEYGLLHEANYSALLFVRADDPATLNANLAALAGPSVLDLTEKDAPQDAVRIEAAVRWLDAHPTWLVIFDNVDDERTAMLAPDPIPDLLIDVAVPGEAADDDAHKARAGLYAYSLITRETGEGGSLKGFVIHRLVQDFASRAMTEERRGEALREALGWVNAAFVGNGDDVRSWLVLDPLAPHTLAVSRRADEAGIAEPTGRLFNQLSMLLTSKARFAEAEPLARRVLAIYEGSYGPDHTNVANCLNNLAELLRRTNRLAEVEPLFRRAQAINQAFWGPDHPLVATGLNNLAELLRDTNRFDEAEPLYRRALAMQEASYGPDHPDVSIALNNLALLLRDTNRRDEAEPLHRRALAIDEASYGLDHPDVARDLSGLATVLHETNRAGEAEPLYRRVPEITQSTLGRDHPIVAICLGNLAELLKATNRPGEAEPLVRRALAIAQASYGPDHPKVAIRLNNLASLLQDTNRLGEAEPLYRRALKIDEASYGPDHPNVSRDLNNLAELLCETNRPGEAEPFDRRALAIAQASYGPDHPKVAIRLNNLASLLQDTNRLGEAEPLYRRALAIDEASYGPNDPKVAMRLNNLAGLLKDTNRLDEAEPLYRRALAIFEMSLGTDHPSTVLVRKNLAALEAGHR